VIEPKRATLAASRVDLRGIGAEPGERNLAGGAIADLARRMAAAAPDLSGGAIAIVDSPRWPRDMDLADGSEPHACRDIRERAIDAALRAMVRGLIESGGAPALRPLALFPTPRHSYFQAHMNAPACKPHLRALGRELFHMEKPVPLHGGTFTRFMIAGFAAYRALEMIGVESYEAYPDLQFRLWSREPILLPKKAGKKAREGRYRVVAALAERIGIAGCERLHRLDELDAAVLALSAAAAGSCGGIVAVLEHSAEGRFMVALDAPPPDGFMAERGEYARLRYNATFQSL
jgi:predicted nuclease with RNAse H fold